MTLYQIYINRRYKTFQVTIYTTRRFSIKCDCKFTLFVHNFNIEKRELILLFCSKILKILEVIIQSDKYKNIIKITQ